MALPAHDRPRLPAWPLLLAALGAGGCSGDCRGPEGPAEACQRLSGALQTGAYYYPWYTRHKWSNEPSTHTPGLGRYDSGDAAVCARHVDWAREAGLKFLVTSFVRRGDSLERNVLDCLRPALARGGLKYCLHYETADIGFPWPPAPDRIDFSTPGSDGQPMSQQVLADFSYLARTHLAHPSYLRLDGRPVVVLYLVRNYVNVGDLLQRLRRAARAQGVDPFLVADVVFHKLPPAELDWELLGRDFDALTGYNLYDARDPDSLAPERQRQIWRNWWPVASGMGLPLIPVVMPGYDDRARRGSQRPVFPRRDGAFLRASWGAALPMVETRTPLLFLTSFNEWHEGTEIEPSLEHGERYLRLMKELQACH